MKAVLAITLLLTSLSMNAQKQEKILFLGASLISGYGVTTSESIPVLFEKRMNDNGKNVLVENAAVPGASTRDGENQFYEKVNQGFVPDYLFIALGISDAMYQYEPAEIKKNLVSLIKKAREVNQEMEIYLFQGKIFQRHVTARVAKAGSPYEKSYEKLFMEVSDEEHVPLLPFVLESIEERMHYFQSDELHPNAQGMKKVMESIWRNTEHLIGA